jgi:hypothetical protein
MIAWRMFRQPLRTVQFARLLSTTQNPDIPPLETAFRILREDRLSQEKTLPNNNKIPTDPFAGIPTPAPFPRSTPLRDEDAHVAFQPKSDKNFENVTATGAPLFDSTSARADPSLRAFENTGGGRSTIGKNQAPEPHSFTQEQGGKGGAGATGGAGKNTGSSKTGRTVLALALAGGALVYGARHFPRDHREALPETVNAVIDKISEETDKVSNILGNSANDIKGSNGSRLEALRNDALDIIGMLWILEANGYLERGVLDKDASATGERTISNSHVNVDAFVRGVHNAIRRQDDGEMQHLFTIRDMLERMKYVAREESEIVRFLPEYRELQNLLSRLRVGRLAGTNQYWLDKK